MIRINLVPGPQKRRAGGGAGLASVKEMLGKVKDPLLIGAVGAWVVCGGVVGVLYLMQAKAYAAVESQQTQLQNEARRFHTLIRQKQRSEALRDSLVAELTAIRDIDADRYVWPHIMEEVTKALPDYTWLVSLDALAPPNTASDSTAPKPPVKFQVDGRTSDISAYTRFVRQLTNSPWLSNIDFGPAQSVMEENRPVTAFTVTVTYRQADSAYIRTQPVTSAAR